MKKNFNTNPVALGAMAATGLSVEAMADRYHSRYRDQFDAYQTAGALARINESQSAYGLVALGQMLDQFNLYHNFCESQGTLASLGTIPQIALDVIAASYGASIIPLLASVQPVQEEHSIVYFKQMIAQQNSGGFNKGDIIRDPRTLEKVGNGNLGAQRRREVLATTVGTTTDYTGNLTGLPIRPFMVEVHVPGVGSGKDNGSGKILGFGFDGEINYQTGAWSIRLHEAVAEGTQISSIFDIDVDAAASIEKVQAQLASTEIIAEIFALATDVGTFANFGFSQRFGRSASDEAAADLSNEITQLLNQRVVRMLMDNAVGNTNWSKTAPQAVSYAEHKLTFIDSLAQAESVIHQNTGAGNVNRILAGRTAAATLRGLPEFTSAPEAPASAIGLFGDLDGASVIRATNVLPDDVLICVANPQGYFNAPLVYAPYMPLMVTSTVQSPDNPFRSTQAAGIWSGFKSVNGALATKLTLTN